MHISNVEFQHESSQSEILAITEKKIVCKLSLMLTNDTNSVLFAYFTMYGSEGEHSPVLLKSMRNRTHLFHQCQCLTISGRPWNLSFIINHRFQYSLQDICGRLYLFLQSKHIITKLFSKEAREMISNNFLKMFNEEKGVLQSYAPRNPPQS